MKIVWILAAAILIGGVISLPLINNHTAYKVEKALCEIPLPEETELIESLSQAGKLTGNGEWDAVFRSNPNQERIVFGRTGCLLFRLQKE